MLDDNDFDVLVEKVGVEFETIRKRARRHGVGALRLSTLETICRTLNREPGDLLVLVDGEGGLSLMRDESDCNVDQQEHSADKKKHLAIAVTALLIAVLTVSGIAIGVSQVRKAQASPTPISDGHRSEISAGAIKGDAKSVVRVNVIADAPDAALTEASVSVVDSSGEVVIAETATEVNRITYLGEFAEGDYELKVLSVPISENGSTYKIPNVGTAFSIGENVGEVEVAVTLEPLPLEDMSSEQLEAVASALEAAGRTDAARLALTASQETPSAPGSAESVKRPLASSSDGAGDDDKRSDNEATPGSVQPSNPVSSSDPEPPSPPSHTCSFAAVTKPVWEADGTTVTDYSKPSYVWGCNDCGITFASSDACYQHQEDNSFSHHTYSDTVYPTMPGGRYVEKPTGEYAPCPVCGAVK